MTIVRARYGGSYEPGAWLAFPNHPAEMPEDWNASDVPCALFWDSYIGAVGAGESPDGALADLAARLGVPAGQTWRNQCP